MSAPIYKRITEPTTEPVTLTEAKDHLRVDGTDDDTYITALIVAAREQVEAITRRSMVTQTWELALDGFPVEGEIEVYHPPLQSVTSIQYLDADGILQTLATTEYNVDSRSTPGRILKAYQKVWPSTQAVNNAVIVTFVAGYGAAASDVPSLMPVAMKLLIGHWYENREQVVTGTIPNRLPDGVESVLSSLVHREPV